MQEKHIRKPVMWAQNSKKIYNNLVYFKTIFIVYLMLAIVLWTCFAFSSTLSEVLKFGVFSGPYFLVHSFFKTTKLIRTTSLDNCKKIRTSNEQGSP